MISKEINLTRLSKLLKNDLLMHAKGLLIVMGIMIVYQFLFFSHKSNLAYPYTNFLFIVGLIVTLFIFKDLHENSKAQVFLLLPCSNVERLVSKWLLTSIIFIIGSLLFYYLFSIVNSALNQFLFHRYVPVLNLFQEDIWTSIKNYFVIQTWFLLGAVTFKRYALLKTLLVGGCIFLAYTSFMSFVAWYTLSPRFPALKLSYYLPYLITTAYYIVMILSVPFCLYLSYLKITEIELR